MNAGIYSIINNVNYKRYIGSATNLSHRKATHISALKLNKHDNSHLQRAWLRYGEVAFSFEVIERVPKDEDLIRQEQFWIDYFKLMGYELYNQRLVASNNLGLKYPHKEETKQRISASLTGKPKSLEHIAKVSQALKGKHPSPETIEKLRVSHRGRRKTHCVRGHERTPDNIDSQSACKACMKMHQAKRYETTTHH